MPARTPSYRLHKPTGQAVVTLNGRDFYLGKHGSPEGRAEYDRLLAEWLASGRQIAPVPPRGGEGRRDAGGAFDELTVNELALGYFKFAETYYRKGGKQTGEVANIRYALKGLRTLYGHTLARDFGPLALKAVREKLIETGICRNEVNRRIRLIVRAFKWAVENEMIPPSAHHGPRAVSGLRKGRSAARESDPIKPVPEAFVDAIRMHVSPQIWAMVQLQRLSGMRPGEACALRTIDLDMSGRIWIYTPATHKMEHHDRVRQIYFGPAAQAVLKAWLRTDLGAYLFQPREAVAAWNAERRRNRRSPMTPSQAARRPKPSPKKSPKECYTTDSYREAIVKACGKAGVPAWHPNQLRHNAATQLRREFGLDVARVILGHSSPVVTEVYADLDREKALRVMEVFG